MKILINMLIFISFAGLMLGCILSSLTILLWNLIPTFAIPVVVALNILRDSEKPYNSHSKTLSHTKNLRK